MKGIIFVIGLLLVLTPFAIKAWNGDAVPIPGINEIVESVRDTQPQEVPLESPKEESKEELGEDEEEEDSAFALQVIEIQKTALRQFQTLDGKYYRILTAEVYDKFAKALTPFYGGRGVVAVKADLEKVATGKSLPLFFSVSIETGVRLIGGEEGIKQMVATATVNAGYSREDLFPLPSTEPIRSVIGGTQYGEKKFGLSRFDDLEDFIREIATDGLTEGGSINPVAWMKIQNQVLTDLKYFGIKSIPSVLVVEVLWSYVKGTEQHTQSLRFFPYYAERQFGVQSRYKAAREGFANALDLDFNRLEEKIKSLVNENKRIEKVWVIYQPHNDSLKVEVRNGDTTVQVALLTNKDLMWEFEQSGGYILHPEATPRDLRTRILNDLHYYEVIQKNDGSTHRSYEKFSLPKNFVRKVRYSKSGQENPTVSYRFLKEALPEGGVLKSREEIDLLIENLMDRGDLEGNTHYYYGCLQTRKEIIDLFNAYAGTQENPFPCIAGFNHHTRMVEVFKKVAAPALAETSRNQRQGTEAVAPPTTTPSDNLYKVSDLSKIDDLKKQITKKYGKKIAETMPSANECKGGIEGAIKKGRAEEISLQGNKITGGYLKFIVVKDTVQYGLVQVRPRQ